MQSGLLRDRIDIESNADTQSAYGGIQNTWSTYAANQPATITPIRGVESGVEAQATYKVTIRYSSDVSAISAKNRIKVLNDSPVWHLDIQAVINVRNRDRMIELLCVEHDA